LARRWQLDTHRRAVDWALDSFYADGASPRGQFVFRFSLTRHARGPSTLWPLREQTARDKFSVPRCFDPVVWFGGHASASFDWGRCKHFMFSPCVQPDLVGPAPLALLPYLPKPPPPSPGSSTAIVTDEIVHVGVAHSTCSKYCWSQAPTVTDFRGGRLVCRNELLRAINNCVSLAQFFPGCSSSEELCQYTAEPIAPWHNRATGECFVSWAEDCDADSENFDWSVASRLCACGWETSFAWLAPADRDIDYHRAHHFH